MCVRSAHHCEVRLHDELDIALPCTDAPPRGSDKACTLGAGLVFMAFGFNLVDCGGLLGQRLGKNIDYSAVRSLKKAKSSAL